jgi:hypothetical protein
MSAGVSSRGVGSGGLIKAPSSNASEEQTEEDAWALGVGGDMGMNKGSDMSATESAGDHDQQQLAAELSELAAEVGVNDDTPPISSHASGNANSVDAAELLRIELHGGSSVNDVLGVDVPTSNSRSLTQAHVASTQLAMTATSSGVQRRATEFFASNSQSSLSGAADMSAALAASPAKECGGRATIDTALATQMGCNTESSSNVRSCILPPLIMVMEAKSGMVAAAGSAAAAAADSHQVSGVAASPVLGAAPSVWCGSAHRSNWNQQPALVKRHSPHKLHSGTSSQADAPAVYNGSSSAAVSVASTETMLPLPTLALLASGGVLLPTASISNAAGSPHSAVLINDSPQGPCTVVIDMPEAAVGQGPAHPAPISRSTALMRKVGGTRKAIGRAAARCVAAVRGACRIAAQWLGLVAPWP